MTRSQTTRTRCRPSRPKIATGTDPDLHAFAEQTLPIIQDHLAMAQGLRGR